MTTSSNLEPLNPYRTLDRAARYASSAVLELKELKDSVGEEYAGLKLAEPIAKFSDLALDLGGARKFCGEAIVQANFSPGEDVKKKIFQDLVQKLQRHVSSEIKKYREEGNDPDSVEFIEKLESSKIIGGLVPLSKFELVALNEFLTGKTNEDLVKFAQEALEKMGAKISFQEEYLFDLRQQLSQAIDSIQL